MSAKPRYGADRTTPTELTTIVTEHGNGSGTAAATRQLRLLFFVRSIHYDRVLENFLRAVLERGHELHVALALEKRGLGEEKTKIFDELSSRYAFSYERLPERRDRWLIPAVALRHGLDYLRYLEPEFANAHPLRERARVRAPRLLRGILKVPPFRGPRGRRFVAATLRRFEAAIPVPKEIPALIKDRNPDAVLVSPLVGLGSVESDYVRAAAELGVPTVLVVASWDNLTNKGLIRDVPTLTIVWNEMQVEEAVRLHKIPEERVVPVGAHSFDHWFNWEPSLNRKEFAKRMRLDPNRPLVLYLGSSYFIAGDETPFVREWLRRVREHPRLHDAAVILRPHPQNVVGWDVLDVDERGRTTVWPRAGEAPTSERQKTDYFDTLFHSSAMVGINTTALIEASILHRPVLTLVNDSFQTQEGTLHFAYIAAENGNGLVTVARSWDEHLDQIADAIEEPEAYKARIDGFLSSFVRPHGLDVPAAPAAAAVVEQAAMTEVEPERPPRMLRGLLIAGTPVLWVAIPLSHPRQTARATTKAARQQLKRVQRRRKELYRARALKSRESESAEAPTLSKEERAMKKETEGQTLSKEERALQKQAKAAEKAKVAEEGKPKGAKSKTEKAGFVAAEGKKGTKDVPARARATRFGSKLRKRTRRMGPVMRRKWKRTKRSARTVYNTRNRRTYTQTIHKLPSRDELPALLNARGLVGRGAEIGVKTGKFSNHLLSKWKGAQLISIDPWLSDDPDAYVDRSNVSQGEHELNYNETKERLAPYGARSDIWRLTSVEGAKQVPDGSLDFVYIDARHDYESVLEDLNAWFSKVKPGGIFAGHDYVDGMLAQGDFGVKSAVDEFFAERNIPVRGTEGPSAVEQFPSWVVEIPAEDGKLADARQKSSVA